MASVSKRKWTHKGVVKEAWVVRYFDEEGVRRAKTFDQKKTADAFRRKVERDQDAGIRLSRGSLEKISDILDAYVKHAYDRAARGEIGNPRAAKIQQWVRDHIKPIIGHLRFQDVTPAIVDDMYAALIAKGLSPFLARMIVGNVSTIERFAQRRGYCHTSHFAAAEKQLRRVKLPAIRTMTIEDARHILAFCLKRTKYSRPDRAAQLACCIHLAACCGLRHGEVRALKWENVDLNAGLLRVRHNFDYFHELKGPKSEAGNGDVWMPQHLVEMLKQWRDRFAIHNSEDLLFTTTAGKRLTHSGLHTPWQRLLKAAGLGEFHFHALRHFAGSWWIENGLHIADVARQLGHSNPATTLRIYTHSVSRDEMRRDAMRHMGQSLLTHQ